MTLQKQSGSSRSTGLENFLSTIRLLESGSYEGVYAARGKKVRGERPVGAYGILESNWGSWAMRAGIAGANWRDPRAQDRVAAHRGQEYFDVFGSWDLAAVAWIGGTESARKVIQRGYDGPDSIDNQEIRDYLSAFQANTRSAPDFGVVSRSSSQSPQSQVKQQAQGGWVMPVAGDNEWSRGSWMPNTLTHRGRTHAATDVYAERGTPIVSPVGGKVISVKESEIGGFTARVQGDDGIIYYFAHMNEAAVVGAGQKILAGAHIGFVGNSGSASSTSPHLHFSMKKPNGDVINPSGYLGGAAASQPFKATAMAYGEGPSRQQSATGQMNNMLDTLSNQIAGGERKPSIEVGENIGEEDGSEVPSTGGEKTTTEVTI